MIPTIRSMLIAVLLTVTALVGGFGLFAAFRVNHGPLARLPVAGTPFQLASIDTVPRALGFAPDQSRLEASEGLRAVETAIASNDAAQTDTSERMAPLATGLATDDVAPEQVAMASAQNGAAPDLPAHSDSTLAEAVAATPTGAPQAADGGAVTEAARAAGAAAETQAEAAANSPSGAAQPAIVAALTNSIYEMPPQQAAAPQVAVLTASSDVQDTDTARQAANRKHLAALRRAHRARVAARAQATYGTSGYGQTSFQTASGFQTGQSSWGGSFGSSATRGHN